MSKQPISDADHMERAPIEVTFGGRVFQVEPLANRASSRWLAGVLRTIERLGIVFDEAGAPVGASPATMLEFKADAIDHLFGYMRLTTAEQSFIDEYAADDDIFGALAMFIYAANPTTPASAVASGPPAEPIAGGI